MTHGASVNKQSEMAAPSKNRNLFVMGKTGVLLLIPLLFGICQAREEYYEKSSFEEGSDGWDLGSWKRIGLDQLITSHPGFPKPEDSKDRVRITCY